MNICSALITDFQTTIAVQPGKGSFDDPTMFTKPFLTFYSTPGNPWSDPTLSQNLAIMSTVVAFVGVQFLRTPSWSTTLLTNGRDGIHHRFQHGCFMHIGRRMSYDERDASSFDHNMALRARFAAIRWVRTGRFAPPGAGTMPASRLARDQSNCSAPASFSTSVWCSRSQMPAACQSRNRRQQVIPLPQPISAGSISQGMPVCRTNMIPAKAARLETRGLPPFGFSGSGGSRGSMFCQSSSLTNCLAIPQSYQFLGFC
jgi:hypothetical protein